MIGIFVLTEFVCRVPPVLSNGVNIIRKESFNKSEGEVLETFPGLNIDRSYISCDWSDFFTRCDKDRTETIKYNEFCNHILIRCVDMIKPKERKKNTQLVRVKNYIQKDNSIHGKLARTNIKHIKPEKDEELNAITHLSHDSIRWMKLRRIKNSTQKFVLSKQRDHDLRQIFNGNL